MEIFIGQDDVHQYRQYFYLSILNDVKASLKFQKVKETEK